MSDHYSNLMTNVNRLVEKGLYHSAARLLKDARLYEDALHLYEDNCLFVSAAEIAKELNMPDMARKLREKAGLSVRSRDYLF